MANNNDTQAQGNGRRQPQSRGNPAGGMTQGSRNDRRAYEFQQQQALRNDWNQVREFEQREQKSRGPTQRSTNWKKQKEEKKAAKEVKTDAATSIKPYDLLESQLVQGDGMILNVVLNYKGLRLYVTKFSSKLYI